MDTIAYIYKLEHLHMCNTIWLFNTYMYKLISVNLDVVLNFLIYFTTIIKQVNGTIYQ